MTHETHASTFITEIQPLARETQPSEPSSGPVQAA